MTMQVWAVIAQKGGSGKTTLTIHTSIAAMQAGMNVLVIDVDPQSSAWKWGKYNRKIPTPEYRNLVVPQVADALRAAAKAKVDLVIIDTSPRADRDSLTIAKLASMIVVPARPTVLDMPAVDDTLALLKSIGAVSRTVTVLNAVASRTNEGANAAAILEDKGPTLSPIRIGERVDYRHSLLDGKGVSEADPRSQASKEIMALTKWLLKQGKVMQ
jgi:chromosome partitioning protein